MTTSEGGNADRANVRVPTMVFLLPMVLSVALHYLVVPIGFTLPDALGGWTARAVPGTLVAFTGLGLQGFAVRELKRAGERPSVGEPTTSIIKAGPFRFSRNPMYLGGVLVHVGVGIATGSIWVLLALVPLIVIVHRVAIVPEEQYLEATFGDEYRAYRASVRRWL